MSNDTSSPAVQQSSAPALRLAESFAALDRFAAANSVTTLLEGDEGAFTLTLKMSAAMQQLREMITPEMMKPIMALQGSSLGFRTDKDKEGGYPESVVKEAMIEATLKGFRMVNNETNIIASRFYAARDGFERIFRDLSKSGRLTDLRMSPGLPKTTGEGAVVEYAASWNWKNSKGDIIKDELKVTLPIKVNNGQGADAILGKAKRKMLAAIYSRITGTEITDGDVDDPKTIDITPPKHAEQPKLDPMTAETAAAVEKLVAPHAEIANKYLVSVGWIREGQTFRDVSEKNAASILKKPAAFLSAAGVKAGG